MSKISQAIKAIYEAQKTLQLEAMTALFEAQEEERKAQAPHKQPEAQEGLSWGLTDELNPVRIQHGEVWFDLSFPEAASLVIGLLGLGPVAEYVEEQSRG